MHLSPLVPILSVLVFARPIVRALRSRDRIRLPAGSPYWLRFYMKNTSRQKKKAGELFRKGKITEKPRIFFAVDDATSQGKKLYSSSTMTAFATQNRHLNIHSWFLLHYDKSTITPKIRQNILWVFIYPLNPKLLESVYEEYIDNDDLDNFKHKFLPFWQK